MTRAACGHDAPVYIKSTGVCQKCYNRTYYESRLTAHQVAERARSAPKPTPSAPASPGRRRAPGDPFSYAAQEIGRAHV